MIYGKKWVTSYPCIQDHELIFTTPYGTESIVSVHQDWKEPTRFCYRFDALGMEKDSYLLANSIEEAKGILEKVYADHIRGQIGYYESLLEQWENGTVEEALMDESWDAIYAYWERHKQLD